MRIQTLNENFRVRSLPLVQNRRFVNIFQYKTYSLLHFFYRVDHNEAGTCSPYLQKSCLQMDRVSNRHQENDLLKALDLFESSHLPTWLIIFLPMCCPNMQKIG